MKNPSFELIKIADNKYRLTNNTENLNESIEIFGMLSADDINGQHLQTSTSIITDINFNSQGMRPYFLIKKNLSKKKLIVAERTLNISGMNNFRDMGGYETTTGETIKWGQLYRGDHLFNADQNGIQYLSTLCINTIIDYRSHAEILKYPNKILGENTKTYNCDPSAHAAELAAQFNSSREDEDINLINQILESKKNGLLKKHSDTVLVQYKAFVNKPESKKAFSDMLKIVLNTSSLPVFQHCRGGKDRTGFGAMLILGILGVDKSIILYDYMITAKNREERNLYKMRKYQALTDDDEVLAHLYSFIAADPTFIDTSINEIELTYGSIAEYAINELDITWEQINAFKQKVLQKL